MSAWVKLGVEGKSHMNQHRALVPRVQDNRRATARHKLFEPVTLRIDGVPIRGHLLDLSRSGALAHAEGRVVPGARVEMEGIGILTPGRVVWVRNRKFGLRFDHWLSEPLVAMIVEGPCALAFPAVPADAGQSAATEISGRPDSTAGQCT